MVDFRGRHAEPQPGTEVARQVVGQRMQRLAQKILQLGHVVGDAAVVVDQMPQGDAVHRLAPQTLDQRLERRLCLGAIVLTIEPIGDRKGGDHRIVRLEGIHPFADRHGFLVEPLRLCLRQQGLHNEVAFSRRFNQGLAELPSEPHQFRHIFAQELGACIEALAEFVDRGFNAATNAVPRLEDDGIDALLHECGRGGEPGKASADDDHLMAAALSTQ